MTAERRAAGEAIAASAPELARLWRATRVQAPRRLWPGLLDGIVADVFAHVGDALAAGADPALAWTGVAGVVRLDARDRERSRAELEVEWDALERVFTGVCEALANGDDVRDWIARALSAARAGARGLGEGAGPPAIVVVWWLSGGAPVSAADAGPR